MRRYGAAIRRAVRAIVLDLDPTPVELFSAQFSIWIALVLFTLPHTVKPQPVKLWAAWALVAGAAKIVGIMPHIVYGVSCRWARMVRGVGDILGIGFWGMLATFLFLLTRGHSLTWGGYAILAAGQAWALFRVWRGR